MMQAVVDAALAASNDAGVDTVIVIVVRKDGSATYTWSAFSALLPLYMALCRLITTLTNASDLAGTTRIEVDPPPRGPLS